MNTEIAIVGGGLSGLYLAHLLHRTGHDFHLFEARDRFGGRILSNANMDLGPSWFWPGQPRIARLADDFELTAFEQYADGALLYETDQGAVHRDMGFSSMQGSLRITGGMQTLIDALRAQIPTDNLSAGTPITGIKDGTLQGNDGSICTANHVVLATPPRVAAGILQEFTNHQEIQAALKAIPTWMAGHAKFIAVYKTPFWRNEGLSGDAMSRRGPLVEIHDASPNDGTHGALFGFLGVPANVREGREQDIKAAAVQQLGHLFGPKAAEPTHTILQDWAFEPYTATPHDHAPLTHHPAYGMPEVLRALAGENVHFCSTEVAPEMGGFLEGALAAAEATAHSLTKVAVS